MFAHTGTPSFPVLTSTHSTIIAAFKHTLHLQAQLNGIFDFSLFLFLCLLLFPAVLGRDFKRYTEIFFPYLKLALENYAAYQVLFSCNGLCTEFDCVVGVSYGKGICSVSRV